MLVLYGMWCKVYVGNVGSIRGMHVHMYIWSLVCPHMHAETHAHEDTHACSLQSFSITLSLIY